MKRKIIRTMMSVMAVLMFTIVGLLGCSNTSDTKPAASSENSLEPTSEKEIVELIVWGLEWATSDIYFAALNEELAAKNIHVTFEPQVMESYINVILSASLAQSGFDIAFDWSGPTFGGKAEKGIWLDISDMVSQEFTDALIGVDACFYDGALLGIPFTIDSQMMFYNKALFEQAGTTAEEFCDGFEGLSAACDKLLAIGVSPMAFANKEGYMNEWFFCQGIGSIYANEDEYSTKFIRNQNFTDQTIVDVLSNYKSAYDAGYFYDGQTLDYASTYNQSFMNGESATLFCGLTNYESLSEVIDAEDIGILPWPSLASDGYSRAYIAPLIYAGASFSKHPEEVVEVLTTMASPEFQEKIFELAGWAPTNTNADVSVSATPIFLEAQALVRKDFFVYPYNYIEPDTLDMLYKEMQLVLTGEMTPSEWCNKMQEASVKAKEAK